MPKRPANDTLEDVQAYTKVTASHSKRDVAPSDEMGEFEDAWEDELESDEEIVEHEVEDNEDGQFSALC